VTRPLETSHTRVTFDADGVATVEIHGAGVLNVLSTPVAVDVTAVIDELAERNELRALVLRGSGERAFIGGADLKQMATLRPDSAKEFISGLAALCESLRQFPTPVIARLPGWCLGAGLEVAAACDIRVAGDDAHFGMPEVAVGIPSVIHGALLPRLIGTARAAWLMLTAESIDAAAALAWGLVHEVVAQPDLDDAVRQAAHRFVELSSSAVRQQKRLLRAWEDMPLEQAVQSSIGEFASAFESGEPQRLMSAFFDRIKQARQLPA